MILRAVFVFYMGRGGGGGGRGYVENEDPNPIQSDFEGGLRFWVLGLRSSFSTQFLKIV